MEVNELLDEATKIVKSRGRRLAPEDREEVVQDVVQKYLEAWPGDTAPKNPSAWLETTVRNRVSDVHRKTARRPEDPHGIGDQDPLALLVGFSQAAPPSLEPVRRRVLDEAFALIDREDADLLRRRFLAGSSSASVAARLGITRAAVDQRVSRAKRTLREELQGRPDLVKELRATHPRVYPDRRPRKRVHVNAEEQSPA